VSSAPSDRRFSRRHLLGGIAISAAGLSGWRLLTWPSQPTAAPAAADIRRQAPPDTAVKVFYSPDYALAGYSFETTRKARWVADSLAESPLPRVQIVAPMPLTEAEVAEVHDPAYVTAVRTGEPRSLAESQGFTWDPGLWSAVMASNGGAVAAALTAWREGGAAGSLSSGLHHAARDRGKGFCTFNGLAIAARALAAAGAQRILILDLDAHCGGGTHSLVGTHPAVWQVDVAVSAFDTYRPATGNTLDLIESARDYLPAIRARLEELPARAGPFEVCLYNAGMDPHEDCPTGGLRDISTEVIAEREALVFDWCRAQGLPVAFVLAGGYTGPRLDRSGLVDLHRLTLAAATR
jgi:acetoin utilization deacetylase AcuC-like enzyme